MPFLGRLRPEKSCWAEIGSRALLAPPPPLPVMRAQPRGLDAPQGDGAAALAAQMSPPMFPQDPLSCTLFFLPRVLKSDLQTLPSPAQLPSAFLRCRSCPLTVVVGPPACLHPAGRGRSDPGGPGGWKPQGKSRLEPREEALGTVGGVGGLLTRWNGVLRSLAPQPLRVKLGVYRQNA